MVIRISPNIPNNKWDDETAGAAASFGVVVVNVVALSTKPCLSQRTHLNLAEHECCLPDKYSSEAQLASANTAACNTLEVPEQLFLCIIFEHRCKPIQYCVAAPSLRVIENKTLRTTLASWMANNKKPRCCYQHRGFHNPSCIFNK